MACGGKRRIRVAELRKRRSRLIAPIGRFLLASTVLALLVVPAAVNAQPVGSTPPTPVSWYGDPKAPNISGVWVRVESANSASKSKEGWAPFPPPLKSEFAAIWNKRVVDAAAGIRTDDPVRGCMPAGMPRFITGMNTPMMILQTPGRVMMYRDGMPVRRIWLDGHPLPAPKDLESFSNGNAMGHYDGQDLVTEVRGIRDQPIDSTGVPHSDELKIVERFHRIDANTMTVQVMLTDSVAYNRPMTSTVTYKTFNDPLWEPREFICTPAKDYHPDIFIK
jgi:hypothetical protein